MTTNSLQLHLQDRINKEHLSLRDVAKETGISHTTISRIVQGGSYDIDTLLKLCGWLEVSPSLVLDGYGVKEDNLDDRVATLIDTNPKLREVFEEAMSRYEAGEVSADAIKDLVAYASYRLSLE